MSIQVTSAASTQVKEFESMRQIFLEIGQQVAHALLLLSSVVSVFSK